MSKDPFDLLAGVVARSDEYLAPGDDSRADALLERLVSSDRAVITASRPVVGHTVPFRRRRAVIAATAVAALVVGGGTVAALVLLRRPADPVTLLCYSEAAAEPATKVAMAIDPEQTPVDQCSPLWSDGTLGVDGPEDLVACVAELEVTVVIPNTIGGCESLGWSPAASPTPTDRVDQLVAAEVPELFDNCIEDLDEARRRVEAMLVDLGAADTWDVTVSGSISPDRPCAGNVIDAAAHVVLIVPFQPPTD